MNNIMDERLIVEEIGKIDQKFWFFPILVDRISAGHLTQLRSIGLDKKKSFKNFNEVDILKTSPPIPPSP